MLLKLPRHPIVLILFCFLFREGSTVAPAKMAAPSVTSVRAGSFVVSYPVVGTAVKYHVTVAARHGTTSALTREVTDTTITIENLTASTLYDVSVMAENGAGETGADSDTVAVQTLPGAPTLRLGTPLSDSVEIFFDEKNAQRVPQWTVQHREVGASSGVVTNTTTTRNQYFAYQLSGLSPDTDYELRASASQLNETDNIQEADKEYSGWQQFRTDSLSIFGSVILTDESYVSAHSTPDSSEWNTSLAIIVQGYTDQAIDHEGISIIRIENGSGRPLVHYRVNVPDKTLPSNTNYTLTGSQFSDSFINNGDVVQGTMYVMKAGSTYTLVFDPTSISCPMLVERYMIVSPEDSTTIGIHLNVATSAATTADEEDSLVIASNGNLILDDGSVYTTMQPAVILGLTPRFLLKSCLENQNTIPLYSESFRAIDADTGNPVSHFFDQTDPALSLLDVSTVTYSSASNGQSVTINVPALKKAMKYEILNGAVVMATLNQIDIDGSDFLKISVSSLSNNTAYSFVMRVTFRKWDGTETTPISFSAMSITPNGRQCASCSANASCTTSIAGVLDCTCSEGFEGNGVSCTPVTTTPGPTTAVVTTVPTTSTTTELLETGANTDIPWWGWLLIILAMILAFVLIVVGGWFIRKRLKKKRTSV